MQDKHCVRAYSNCRRCVVFKPGHSLCPLMQPHSRGSVHECIHVLRLSVCTHDWLLVVATCYSDARAHSCIARTIIITSSHTQLLLLLHRYCCSSAVFPCNLLPPPPAPLSLSAHVSMLQGSIKKGMRVGPLLVLGEFCTVLPVQQALHCRSALAPVRAAVFFLPARASYFVNCRACSGTVSLCTQLSRRWLCCCCCCCLLHVCHQLQKAC